MKVALAVAAFVLALLIGLSVVPFGAITVAIALGFVAAAILSP